MNRRRMLKKYAPGPTKVRVCNGNFDFEKTGDTTFANVTLTGPADFVFEGEIEI